jgi:hypothetical protein
MAPFQIEQLICYLRAHKCDVVNIKHVRAKMQDLGIPPDDASAWRELERAGFWFVGGACELLVKPENINESTERIV